MLIINNYNSYFSLVIPAEYNDFMNCSSLLIKSISYSCKYVKEIIIIVSGVGDRKDESLNNNIKNIYSICKKSHILLYKNKQNQALNKNIGIKYSKGKYISFFDSDDVISKFRFIFFDKLLRLRPEIDLILHKYTYKYKQLLKPPDYNNINKYIENLSYSYIINQYKKKAYKDKPKFRWCCKYINKKGYSNGWLTARRSVLKKHQFDTHLKIGEDSDLNARLILDNGKLSLINYYFGVYYIGSKKCLSNK